MIKRVTALLMCFLMLVALPLSALASEDDAGAPAAPASVRYISSGSITFGTAVLYDAYGNELPLEYAYSPRITISQSIAEQLTEMLRECGFALPAIQFDYQMMNMQSFFVVRVTDGAALAKVIDAMVSEPQPEEVTSGSDAVSASDVSSSDVSESDAFVIPPYEGGTQFETPKKINTSLHALLLGAATFDAYSTLETSFANAFPEFTFQAPAAVALPQTLNSVSGITVEPDGMSASITVMPEPEYVEREVFGEVFQVLMVSSAAYRYQLTRLDIAGGTEGAVIPERPVVSDSDVTEPEEETTTTEATTTTTTASTTTTTQSSTASESASTTTTTTTTTVRDDDNDGFPRSGVVTTQRLRLNVRSGPGTGYKVIGKLDKGDKVTVVSEKDGWYEIELSGGKTGWCTSEYITLR